MSNVTTTTEPSLIAPGEGDAYWFLGALATIKASTETTGGAVAAGRYALARCAAEGVISGTVDDGTR